MYISLSSRMELVLFCCPWTCLWLHMLYIHTYIQPPRLVSGHMVIVRRFRASRHDNNLHKTILFKHQVSLLGSRRGHMVKLVSSGGQPFFFCFCWMHKSGIGPSCCHLHADQDYCAWRIFCAIAEVITSYIRIVVFWWSSFASPSVLSVCLYHSLCVQGFNLFNDSLELSSSEASHEVCEAWFLVVASLMFARTASIALAALARHACCRPFKGKQLHLGWPRRHRTSSIYFVWIILLLAVVFEAISIAVANTRTWHLRLPESC